jgi:hypothetical protein
MIRNCILGRKEQSSGVYSYNELGTRLRWEDKNMFGTSLVMPDK